MSKRNALIIAGCTVAAVLLAVWLYSGVAALPNPVDTSVSVPVEPQISSKGFRLQLSPRLEFVEIPEHPNVPQRPLPAPVDADGPAVSAPSFIAYLLTTLAAAGLGLAGGLLFGGLRGAVVTPPVVIDPAPEILALKRELAQFTAPPPVAESARAEWAGTVTTLERELRGKSALIDSLHDRIRDGDERLTNVESDMGELAGRLDEANEARNDVQAVLEAETAALASERDENRALSELLAEAREAGKSADQTIGALEGRIMEIDQAWREAETALEDTTARLQSRDEAFEAQSTELADVVAQRDALAAEARDSAAQIERTSLALTQATESIAQLNADKESMHGELDRRIAAVAALEEQLGASTTAHGAAQAELEELHKRADEQQRELDALRADHAQLRAAADEGATQLTALEAKLSGLRDARDRLIAELDVAGERLLAADGEHAELLDRAEQAEHELEEIKTLAATLEADLEGTQRQLAALAELPATVVELEQSLAATRMQLGDATSGAADLEVRLGRAHTELASVSGLTDDVARLHGELAASRERLADADADKAALQRQLEAAHSEVEAAAAVSEQFEQLQQQTVEIANKLTAATAAGADLEARLETTAAELETARALSDDVARLEQELDGVRVAEASLQSKLAVLGEERDQAVSRSKEYEQALADTTRSRADLDAGLVDAASRIQSLETVNAGLNARVDAMTASLSERGLALSERDERLQFLDSELLNRDSRNRELTARLDELEATLADSNVAVAQRDSLAAELELSRTTQDEVLARAEQLATELDALGQELDTVRGGHEKLQSLTAAQASTIDEHRTEFERKNRLIDELHDRISSLAAQLDTAAQNPPGDEIAAAHAAAQAEQIETLQQALGAANDSLGAIEADRDGLAAQLEAVEATVATLSDEAGRVTAIASERDQLQTKLEAVEATVATLSDEAGRVTAIESERDQLQTKLEAVEATVAALSDEAGRIPAIESERDQLQTKLAAVEATVAALSDEAGRVTAIASERDQLQTKLDAVEATVATLSDEAGRIPVIESERDQLLSKLKAAEATVTQVSSAAERLAIVELERDSLAQQLTVLEAAAEQQTLAAERIAALESENIALAGKFEIAEATASDVATLREQLSALADERDALLAQHRQVTGQLEASLASSRERVAELDERISLLDAEREEVAAVNLDDADAAAVLNEQLHALQAAYDERSSRLEFDAIRMTDLEAQLAARNEALGDIRAERDNLADRIAETTGAAAGADADPAVIADLQEKLDVWKSRVGPLAANLKARQGRIVELESELEAARANAKRMARAQDEIHDVRVKLRARETALRKLAKHYKKRDEQTQALRVEIGELRGNQANADAELRMVTLESELRAQADIIAVLEKDSERLKETEQTLSERTMRLSSIEARLRSVSSELEEQRSGGQGGNGIPPALTDRMRKMERQIDTLESALRDREETIARLQDVAGDLDGSHELLGRGGAQNVDALRDELEASARVIDTLEEDLQHWKMLAAGQASDSSSGAM